MKKTLLAIAIASAMALSASANANGNNNPGTSTTTGSLTVAGNLGGYTDTVGGSVSSQINSNLNIGSYVSGSGSSVERASSNMTGSAGIAAVNTPTGVTVSSETSQTGNSSAYGNVSAGQPGIVSNGEGGSTIYNGAVTGGSVTNVADIQTNTFQGGGIGGVFQIGGIASVGNITTPGGGNDNGQGNNGHDNGNH